MKQEVEEAKKYIAQSLEVWLPHYRAVRDGKADTGSFDPVEVCPLSYATRLTTARILIEVEDHKSAVEVLEGLTEEDDEVRTSFIWPRATKMIKLKDYLVAAVLGCYYLRLVFLSS